LNNKIFNNNFINKFYKGSEIEKFIIENFESTYDVKPYVAEEEYKKTNNENELKEKNKIEIEKQEIINNNNTENYENDENNEDKKDVIEPFKLSVEEIKKLYENIKLEINKLD
jgi:hypothetical protein